MKGSYEVVKLRARTVEPDGSIVNFDPNAIEQVVVKSKNVKVLSKAFVFPDVRVGSILEYSYTYDLKDLLYDSRWILSSDLFTKHARFSLEKYSRPALWWTWHNLPPGTAEPVKSGNVISMEASNIPAFRSEEFMPPENELKSRVEFTYSPNAEARPTPEQFWKLRGKRWNGYLEDFLDKRKAMDRAVSEIVSPNDSPDTKLRKLYDRVQSMRNRSFEEEKTQQEWKRDKDKLASNVEDVWKRGYGNITELNWLFLGLARAAGFEAYGCWISSRRNSFFTPDWIDESKLASNIVLVKTNGKEVYLDPGEEFTPFGMLYWTLTGVQGLRLDKDGGTWIRTPIPESTESRTQREGNLKLSPDGDLEGTVKVTYSGLDSMYYRDENRAADSQGKKKFLESDIQKQIPGGSDAELINTPDWTGSETPFVTEFRIKIPSWASAAGSRRLISAAVFSAPERHIFESTTRVHPLYLEYPFQKEDNIAIELPPDWKISSIPSNQDLDAPAAGYSLSLKSDKNTLHMTRKLKLDFLLLEPKFYPALRDFFQFVRTGDEEKILLQPATVAAGK